jgi:hypothetical protein
VALAGGIALFLAIATVRLSLLDRWDVPTAARLVVAALAGGLAATGAPLAPPLLALVLAVLMVGLVTFGLPCWLTSRAVTYRP